MYCCVLHTKYIHICFKSWKVFDWYVKIIQTVFYSRLCRDRNTSWLKRRTKTHKDTRQLSLSR
jgi:hypothetical protein